MEKGLAQRLFERKYKNKCSHLCKKSIIQFLNEALELAFPQMGHNSFESSDELALSLNDLENRLRFILKCIHKELGADEEHHESIIKRFFKEVPAIERLLTQDAEFIAREDPACESVDEVYICYPGFFAIATHRIASFFHQQNVPVFPRVLSEYAHQKTGIDIHPGAKIGSPFFIDHGTGVVIGESAIIGDFCKIFQGVTLGALSVKKEFRTLKRHPTIGDNCIIYSNAVILGGDTSIGSATTIGGNVWITESIPENSQVFRRHGFNIKTKPK